MATLDAKTRAALPDSAFAYVDSKGNRRLPIHDESHVRNALSRFNQVKFESAEARERAFEKLLKAAIGYGIAPVGFVAAQMRAARARDRPDLPSGQVTLMLTDIEGSTGLVDRLGDGYPAVLADVTELIRSGVTAGGGYEVDDRADEFFGVFPTAVSAVGAAVSVQLAMAERSWPEQVRIRIGLHSGTPARTETGYIGIAVNTAARICFAGHGGQILASESVKADVGSRPESTWRLESVGRHALRGLPDPVGLYQVRAPDLLAEFPALRVDAQPAGA
jgi:class 3 adenylate cyclase